VKERAVKESGALPPRSGTVALVGRPNVGKSTLLNAAIGQALAIVSPVPQTTRDRILGVLQRGGVEMLLLDTPGLHRPESDRLRDKTALFPLLEELGKLRDFAATVPISARSENGIDRVLDEVAPRLPERPFTFEPDDLTDRPIRFFASEYVREQILRVAREEVPHATAVEIERFDESTKVVHIDATIHVEREGQRGILIGERGARLKAIGIGARASIEKLLGRKVHLSLWVRVTPDWTQSPEKVAELVYGKAGESSS
jgi:GTPase Era involved in 16S rRNA processing